MSVGITGGSAIHVNLEKLYSDLGKSIAAKISSLERSTFLYSPPFGNLALDNSVESQLCSVKVGGPVTTDSLDQSWFKRAGETWLDVYKESRTLISLGIGYPNLAIKEL